jgi:hypothetical protein
MTRLLIISAVLACLGLTGCAKAPAPPPAAFFAEVKTYADAEIAQGWIYAYQIADA